MSTKKQGVPCFDNAAPDEPIFVLRAQDRLAAATVRFWAQLMEASRGRAALVKEVGILLGTDDCKVQAVQL